jgi:lon-related putative ATP-dependent protease
MVHGLWRPATGSPRTVEIMPESLFPAPLPVSALRRVRDPARLSFAGTDELPDLGRVIGQDRAVGALEFGFGIRREGYNLYVMGPPGIGKHSLVRRVLEARAEEEPQAPDWVYVNNFDEPHKPLALALPASWANRLQRDMAHLIEDLQDALPTGFDSDEYRERIREFEGEVKQKEETELSRIRARAEGLSIALIRTPSGFGLAPLRDGEVLSPEAFSELPEAERQRIESEVEELQESLHKLARRVPRWRREAREQIREVNKQVTQSVVDPLLEELKRRYPDLPEVQTHLSAVERDILENVDDFLPSGEQEGGPAVGATATASLKRYQVNALVHHDDGTGAPLVYEDNPTLQNLVGRIEHIAQLGTLVTDFTLIKPGALHCANGGYLVLDARHVLSQPFAWEALKRILYGGEIRIVSLSEMYSLASTVSLEPQTIPLQVKVLLLGERLLYYLLSDFDPDFRELFKIAADLEEDIDGSEDNEHLYAQMIATLVRKQDLRPFTADGVCRVLEHSARMADDAEKLSLEVQRVTDLLQEADHWAAEDGAPRVAAGHVQRAIDAAWERHGRMREKLLESVARGLLLLDTAGETVGQVNGLSVLDLRDIRFGHVSRITATVRVGSDQVVDVEREVELGGALHSKGVMILSGFLGARYARERPLSLKASLAFEQSYGQVEGDSASLAELCALLSALADLPVRQSMALTGSVNQRGQVQAIGGVNEKIEGFYDVCEALGGVDGQAVVIPASNVSHLMLRENVVQAVAEGRFAVYPATHVDQAIELLTGVPAGERGEDGDFPETSVNGRVERCLVEYAERRQTQADAETGVRPGTTSSPPR